MNEKLYGTKCHICACLRHDRCAVEPKPWLPLQPLECADCPFCRERALHRYFMATGGDMFDPEVRAAVVAFRDGKDHPLIDALRAEIVAEESRALPEPEAPQ